MASLDAARVVTMPRQDLLAHTAARRAAIDYGLARCLCQPAGLFAPVQAPAGYANVPSPEDPSNTSQQDGTALVPTCTQFAFARAGEGRGRSRDLPKPQKPAKRSCAQQQVHPVYDNVPQALSNTALCLACRRCRLVEDSAKVPTHTFALEPGHGGQEPCCATEAATSALSGRMAAESAQALQDVAANRKVSSSSERMRATPAGPAHSQNNPQHHAGICSSDARSFRECWDGARSTAGSGA